MKIRFNSEEERLKTKYLKSRDRFLECNSKEELQNLDLFFPALKECVENKDLHGTLAVSTAYVNSFCEEEEV